MQRKTRRWLVAAGLLATVTAGAGYIAVSRLSNRVEPYIRQQAVDYLSRKFDSDVELKSLDIRLPKMSPFRMLLKRGSGVKAKVEGRGVVLRPRESPGSPPLFQMDRFSFEVDLGTVLAERKTIDRVTLDNVKIHVPPKGERPRLSGPKSGEPEGATPGGVLIREVLISNATLVILPKDARKKPLEFDIRKVKLESTGTGVAMKYNAELTNPKPPGQIHSRGTFGPWAAGHAGDTPLAGEYVFQNADLGVFKGIAGILQSTGSFEGTLDSIQAKGVATVPDFRLKRSGNRVPLSTRFKVLVDGGNGNTILQPVMATLGGTKFTTSGGVIRHDGDERRTIDLTVNMPDGQLSDLIRLAVKGTPIMKGRIAMSSKIMIPPLSGKVREKLRLDGQFEIFEGAFLRAGIQEQIDGLSRRGQGQPGNQEIEEVISSMAGSFKLEDEELTFRSLSFAVPGAGVDLAGAYRLDDDTLDLRGSVRLLAKVSQTQAGWKRWALKPVDPFFSKNGAGTFLRIKVEGSSKEPKFGLDRGGSERATADRTAPAAR